MPVLGAEAGRFAWQTEKEKKASRVVAWLTVWGAGLCQGIVFIPGLFTNIGSTGIGKLLGHDACQIVAGFRPAWQSISTHGPKGPLGIQAGGHHIHVLRYYTRESRPGMLRVQQTFRKLFQQTKVPTNVGTCMEIWILCLHYMHKYIHIQNSPCTACLLTSRYILSFC